MEAGCNDFRTARSPLTRTVARPFVLGFDVSGHASVCAHYPGRWRFFATRLPDGSAQASGTLVHKGHWLGSWHVASLQLRNMETGILDERRDRTVQVASAGDSLPDRR